MGEGCSHQRGSWSLMFSQEVKFIKGGKSLKKELINPVSIEKV